MVPDAVRFTLTYSAERYADGVRADVDRLKAEGFELIKLKNLWAGDQYKGINSQWRRPETGLRFEMQFHTLESLEAKELTHKAYERIRSIRLRPPSGESWRTFQSRVNALDRYSSRHCRDRRLPGEEPMAEKITYYAIIDEFSSRDSPRRRAPPCRE